MTTQGVTAIGNAQFDTTGVLGASRIDGQLLTARGFPSWATLPGPNGWRWRGSGILRSPGSWCLNGGPFHRLWIVEPAISRATWRRRARDIAHLPREIADHARLKFPHEKRRKRYNALQKLAYCSVIFVLGPLIVMTGLAMSPTMDCAFPILPWLFGGRQSARTIHFLCAFSFLGFFIVHIVMVVLSGSWNNLRSMITGWYVIRGTRHD